MPDQTFATLPLLKRLSYKQTLLVMLMALALGFLFSFLQIYLDYFSVRNESETILQQVFKSTKQPAAQATYTFDTVLAEEIVKGLFDYPPIYKVILLESSQQEQLAMLERDLYFSHWRWLSKLLFGDSKHYDIALVQQREQCGILKVSVDTHLLATGFFKRAVIVLLSGLVHNFLLALFLLYLFHIVITKPLFEIATTLATIDPIVPEKTRLSCPMGHTEDELGQLVKSTNELLCSIDEQTTEREDIFHSLAIAKEAFKRFVPSEFLRLLSKESVIDVKLGDQVEKEMTILFSDIRDFTALSETMTPQDNFDFVNAYLSQMAPIIEQHNGFIDKYIGDAIMALFPYADDAVKGAVAILQQLKKYNQTLQHTEFNAIRIGIGINSGLLMLGTLGGTNRMDGTVISDAVNLASRIEGLTKIYGTSLLISEHTYAKLEDPYQYNIRVIDATQVKGKSKTVTIYEIFDADTPDNIALKNKTISDFEPGFVLYHSGEIVDAKPLFETVLQINPYDTAAQVYLERCKKIISMTMPENPVILVVDDMSFNLKILTTVLDNGNFKTLVAKNGESALEIIKLTPPHLILLDIMMPGINGYEVCERLKANPKTEDIPIIFITALSKVADKVKGFKLGAVDYITKPFQREEVLARVKTHLHLSHLQRQAQWCIKKVKNTDVTFFNHTKS
jgi:class 3 adenylate cyclase/CheY-like chemotaxis protein